MISRGLPHPLELQRLRLLRQGGFGGQARPRFWRSPETILNYQHLNSANHLFSRLIY